MIRILIFLLLLSSCDKPQFVSDDITEYPEYGKALSLFEREFHRPSTEFRFITKNPIHIAACSGKVIGISKPYWENISSKMRVVIVFHELVHCELDVHHFGEGLMNMALFNQMPAFYNNFECQIEDIKTIIKMRNAKQILDGQAFTLKYAQMHYDECTKVRPYVECKTPEAQAIAHTDLDKRIEEGQFYLWDDLRYVTMYPVGIYQSKRKIQYNVCGGKY